MAYDRVSTSFDVQPDEARDGTLSGVRIQRTARTVRMSEDGRELDRGRPADVGEPLQVPLDKLADLIRELVSWPEYYASGQAAADRRDPVSWPNSRSTVDTQVCSDRDCDGYDNGALDLCNECQAMEVEGEQA